MMKRTDAKCPVRGARLRLIAACLFAVFAAPLFAADFTWTGEGTDDLWTTPANWGVESGCPGGGDRAIFPAGCTAVVEIGSYQAVNSLMVREGANLTLKAIDMSSASPAKLDLKSSTGYELGFNDISITLDHAYIERNNAITFNSGAVLAMRNGSDWHVADLALNNVKSISVESGSTMRSGKVTATGTVGTVMSVNGATWTAGEFILGGNTTNLLSNGAKMTITAFTVKNAPDSLLSIDDSTFITTGNVTFGDANPGGGHIVFKGANPVFQSQSNFKATNNNAGMTTPFKFDFEVPEGGFAAVPIQHRGIQVFKDSGNIPNDYYQIRILESSPALSAGTQTDCPLIFSFANGIARSKVYNGDDTTATFRLTDTTGAIAATDDGSAKALYVTIGSGDPATPTANGHGDINNNYTKTAVARNAITAYGYVTALATDGDTTSIELWVGTVNNAASMVYVDTVTPTTLGEFTATYTAAENIGEVTHYFQWRLFDIDPSTGATNYTAASSAFSAITKDTTTYTWKDVNGDWDGDWTDPAHWSSDYASANGYPNSSSATAVFPAGHPLVVTISANSTVGTLDLTANANLTDASSAYGVDVTFQGAAATGTNCFLTVQTAFKVKSALGTVTLDNAAIKVNGGVVQPITGKTIRLINGADLYCGSNFELYYGGIFELSGKSTANVNCFYISSTGSSLTLDDSRLTVRAEVPIGSYGGGSKIVFKGKNPLFYVWNSNNILYFNGNNDNDMTFNVPVGGYDEPVIQARVDISANDLFRKNSKTATLTFSIDPNSPFYSTVGTIDQPLIAWRGSKAIDRSNLAYAEVSNGGYFMLGTSASDPYGFANVASFSGTAKSLGVHLVSVAHDGKLDVASDAPVELEGYSPALGTAAASGSITATAPASYVADGVRYSCTGYTLTEYVVGTADTVSGTPTEASGSSVTFTLPAGGAKIEWHYATDYVVAATAVNDANGVVAKSADYVSASSPVTLTASTTSPGMEFQYWYGDVPYESRYDNPVTVSGDKAKSVYAFFGATAANAATRTLTYEGNTGKEWFNTSHWADGVIPGTNDTAVLVNTSNYNLHQSQNKGRIIAPSFVAVGNLVVSNAVLLVGARYASYNGNLYENNNLSEYWGPDQNGNYSYKLSVAYDDSRTNPVGLDVFGDVVLDSHNRSYSNGNSGGVVFVGGTTARCNTRVNIAGDLDIVNGAFGVVAGYPFDFVADSSKNVNNTFIEFNHPQEFFRGGNYLKVGGTTHVRTSTATKVHNFLQVANDFRTGAAVWLDLNDVEVEEGASITSFFGGYGSFNELGVSGDRTYSCCPGGHQVSDTYDGGCHGGLGGKGNGAGDGYDNPTTYATTYDYELTPMYPGNRCGGSGNDRGAGSIRLDCATLNLDGGLIATGRSGGKGGTSGGSIWVVCDTFNFGDNCQVFADGGDKNCGGGGGRIAICEGLTDDQVTNLWATHAAPQDVTVTDLADKLGARMTVAGGTGILGKYSKGYPGTAFYLVNTAGKKTLTVAGDPANLGTPAPAYGPQVFDEGENIAFSAPGDAFATDDNRSRRVAVGYTITDTETGAVIADENATSGVVTLTGDWTLTWDLTLLQHSLDISAATPGGTITTNAIGAAGEAWQDDGSALSVTAVPASGYRFAGWFGEIAEAVQYDATFSTNVTGALRVRAVFVSDDADTATWTGAGDGANFLDAANWSTGKVPGPKSAVVVGGDASVTGAVGLVFNVKSLTVASGASLAILPEGTYSTRDENPHVYPETISSYDLHDCGIVASGDIYVAGTLVVGSRHSLAKATAAAGGAFTIAEGASATVNGGYDDSLIGATATPALWRNYGAVASAGGTMTVNGTLALYGDALSGSPVKVAANRLMIGETGVLRADEGGWGWKNYHGARLTYALGAPVSLESYNGGAYGGFGGGYNGTPANVTDYVNKRTYGEPLRPYLPGSPGPNNDYPFGGGALRIVVEGQISNAGRISANGVTAGGSTGGGSGGGIWITCHKFVNGAEGSLLARGGNNTNNGGAGGGGRILVCERLDAEKINALYTTGVVPEKVTATEITDANRAEFSAGAISADGGTNINNSATYPCWSGTAGSIWWLRGRGLGTFIMVR